jgi:acyl carrier protein
MNVDPQVLEEVLELMTELAGDWEHEGTITPDTYFLADMELESLDLVVIGTAVQQRYGTLPFAEHLAEIGQRPIEERDLTVGELVEFICRHRQTAAVMDGAS